MATTFESPPATVGRAYYFPETSTRPIRPILKRKVGKTSTANQLCVKLMLALFVLAVIVALVAATAVLITQEPVDLSLLTGIRHRARLASANYSRLSMDGLLMGSGGVRPDYFSMWLNDDSLLMLDEDANLIKFSIIGNSTTPKSEIFIKRDQFKPDHKAKNLIFNANAKYVTIFKPISQIYRHSHRAIYEIARLEKGHLGNYHSVGPKSSGNEPLQLFAWNPAPDTVDFVFVYENNIYHQSDPADPGSCLPITTTGNQFKYHGVTDWLYEEEIFSSTAALWWSPSGNHLAFASFDDRNVTRIRVPQYDPRNSYPEYDEVPYPKAGALHQPGVYLWLWNKAQNSTQLLMPPNQLFNARHGDSFYLFSAQWISIAAMGEILIAVWANRLQNDIFITLCPINGKCFTHFRQKFDIDGRKMWSEPGDFRVEWASKSGYFLILPHKIADGDVYNHAAHIAIEPNTTTGTVTSYFGEASDVEKIVGYDLRRDELFFISSGGQMASRNLYRTTRATIGDGLTTCISCLTPACPSAYPKFSLSGRQFVLNCRMPYRNSKPFLKQTNDILRDFPLREDKTAGKLAYEAPTIVNELVTLSSGIAARVQILHPPLFRDNEKYPLLLYVYSGPNTNQIKSETPWDFMTYLSVTRQYVILTIDARGSGQRGWTIKEPLFRQFGGPEIDDQIEATRLILQKYRFLDRERVAVFGWSYGGFVSTHIAARGTGIFQCAIAVAPVVDFRFYDSAYTERYMGLPLENVRGYEKASLLSNTAIANLRNVTFLLAHGDADDNVHYQNSALLAQALQERGSHFKQLVYTNQDHTIRAAIGHLYMEVDRFLLSDCYGIS